MRHDNRELAIETGHGADSVIAGERALRPIPGWALRVPGVRLSWPAVRLIALAAATRVGRPAGRWAAWLAALSPFLLQHAQEARMYALVVALAAFRLVLLARFVTGATAALRWA